MENENITLKDAFKLMACIFIPLFAGFIGGIATSKSVSTWYLTLSKPWFNPPGWIFAPVWTLLYIAMGLSLFLVWRQWKTNNEFKLAVSVFAAQLALNVFWSFAFFGFQAPAAGLVTILLLLPMIGFMIYKFYKIDKWAGYLNIPYFLWVCFATILNLAIVVLN